MTALRDAFWVTAAMADMNIPGVWVVQGALLVSFAIAIAWLIGNPLIIIVGYYMRDRSHDDE